MFEQSKQSMGLPKISVVIIGLNTASSLIDCIQSVKACNYNPSCLEIIYVDGGSRDESVEIAKRFSDVKIIQLYQNKPTPGRGRNAGWKAAAHEFVQFLDGDTTLEASWLTSAVPYLVEHEKTTAAVTGKIFEKYPRKNMYHLIAHIEWDTAVGPIDHFGGNVLIKKEALKEVGGYDDYLIAGEDPDLAYRLLRRKKKIYCLPQVMSLHNIQMDSFKAYFLRTCRTGHGFAELAWRYRREQKKLWMREIIRISASVILPWICIGVGYMVGHPIWGILFAGAFAFRALRKTWTYAKKFQISLQESLLYTTHLAFAPYPQTVGMLQFIYKKICSKFI